MFMALICLVPTGAANVSLPCDDGGLWPGG
jgi:hypothetical protein